MIRNIPVDILLNYHRLTPVQINLVLGEDFISDDIDARLRSLEMVSELVKITDRLKENDIEFIPLKGPVLSYRLHKDLTFRHYRDLDILVRPSSFRRAADVLVSLGYLFRLWPVNFTKRQEQVLQRHANDISFINIENTIIIELHWAILRVPVISNAELELLTFSNIEEIELPNCNCKVLNNELELVHLVIHGGRHWWRRLKWLIDIKDFLNTCSFDQSKFLRIVEELKAERMVALCNSMLDTYLPESQRLPCYVPARKFMVQFAIDRIKTGKEPIEDFFERGFKSIWYSLLSFPGLKYKLKILRSYLFVTQYYGNNRYLSLLPVFYIYGPIRLLLHRLKR